MDWNENPTITSLDSIAAPINDIQFPTITVCNDKLHEVQDNWSFLETILNFFDYDLNMEKDFQLLFRSIKDVDTKKDSYANGRKRFYGISDRQN